VAPNVIAPVARVHRGVASGASLRRALKSDKASERSGSNDSGAAKIQPSRRLRIHRIGGQALQSPVTTVERGIADRVKSQTSPDYPVEIVLGYLITRETLAVIFANHNPPAIPPREWFEDLLPRAIG